ncbi:sarcosine oxidase, gamma subunit family protein [Roseobacter sp. SK209-2-6]|uniref:sarcosine oxidase subunit gamma n=1 Tax=Roseobacter sp. SK209-2-6 TaxID=388739 RepID=UPI0000F3F307|nr:sarcosine oxidase subunit gamma family protein [Roseobacter sp. SK209-2-6]EBA16361.1 sarcosine oxidase, gamma subunit family protein [Roseobacter sp. SK209-2-6]
MSNPVTATNGARFSGIATVEDAGLQGMITLRGDLSSKTLAAAVKAATGAGMPARGKIEVAEGGAAAWMSPDELLLLVPYGEAVAKTAELAEALKGEHALAANVSDARSFFRVSGEGAREVLAKISPVDLSPAAFQAGDFRRSRTAQVAAALWLQEDGAFYVVCFRSVGAYMFDLLKTSAHPQSAVGVY